MWFSLRRTAVTAISCSTIEGTIRVLWCYGTQGSRSYASARHRPHRLPFGRAGLLMGLPFRVLWKICVPHWIVLNWSKLTFIIRPKYVHLLQNFRDSTVIYKELEWFSKKFEKKVEFCVFSKSFASEIHNRFCYIHPVTLQKISCFCGNLHILRPVLKFNEIKVVLKSAISNKKRKFDDRWTHTERYHDWKWDFNLSLLHHVTIKMNHDLSKGKHDLILDKNFMLC